MAAPAGVSPDGRPVLRVRGLHKRFGALRVLRGVDLDLAPARSSPWSARTGRQVDARPVRGPDVLAEAGTVE